MSATVTHPDVATDRLMQVLAGDSILMNIEVTMLNSLGTLEQRKIQGVYYITAPQEPNNVYPCVIINAPILHDSSYNKSPNAPQEIGISDFLQTVRFAFRDVEPDDAKAREMRARGTEILPGLTVTSDGWICSFSFREWLVDKRQDNGTYIYSEIGFKVLGCVNRI